MACRCDYKMPGTAVLPIGAVVELWATRDNPLPPSVDLPTSSPRVVGIVRVYPGEKTQFKTPPQDHQSWVNVEWWRSGVKIGPVPVPTRNVYQFSASKAKRWRLERAYLKGLLKSGSCGCSNKE